MALVPLVLNLWPKIWHQPMGYVQNKIALILERVSQFREWAALPVGDKTNALLKG